MLLGALVLREAAPRDRRAAGALHGRPVLARIEHALGVPKAAFPEHHELLLALAQRTAPAAGERLNLADAKVPDALGVHVPVHGLPRAVARLGPVHHDAAVVAHAAAQLVACAADVNHVARPRVHDSVNAGVLVVGHRLL